MASTDAFEETCLAACEGAGKRRVGVFGLFADDSTYQGKDPEISHEAQRRKEEPSAARPARCRLLTPIGVIFGSARVNLGGADASVRTPSL